MNDLARIAFVGFGEAGGILGSALAAKGVQVSMFDLRRAAEMREVSQTPEEAGITPFMSEACARLQDNIVDAMQEGGIDYGSLGSSGSLPAPFDWRAFFDALPD